MGLIETVLCHTSHDADTRMLDTRHVEEEEPNRRRQKTIVLLILSLGLVGERADEEAPAVIRARRRHGLLVNGRLLHSTFLKMNSKV